MDKLAPKPLSGRGVGTYRTNFRSSPECPQSNPSKYTDLHNSAITALFHVQQSTPMPKPKPTPKPVISGREEARWFAMLADIRKKLQKPGGSRKAYTPLIRKSPI